MRTLSFVERLELEFYSKVGSTQQPLGLCQEAIALGDVDNDEVSSLDSIDVYSSFKIKHQYMVHSNMDGQFCVMCLPHL